MTYYISGPMTGLPDFNRTAFEMVARQLRAKGHMVFLPEDSWAHPNWTYRELLARDMDHVFDDVDALYMLKGWEYSPGARAEHAVAVALELPIAYEGEA